MSSVNSSSQDFASQSLYINGVPASQIDKVRISMPATKAAVIAGTGICTIVVCTATAALGFPVVAAVCAVAAAVFAAYVAFSSVAPGLSEEKVNEQLKSTLYSTLHKSQGLGSSIDWSVLEPNVNALVKSIEVALVPFYTKFKEQSPGGNISNTTFTIKNAQIPYQNNVALELPIFDVEIGPTSYRNKVELDCALLRQKDQ